MTEKKTTALSGCLIWLILVVFIGSCLMPIAVLVGSISSTSDYVIENIGAYICPEGTTPSSHTYQTTTADEFGNRRPATAYELHCIDSNGDVVQKDPVGYAFAWVGILALVAVVLTGVLAFVFAVPGGMLVTRLLNKLRTPRV
jgi:ABC-type glycerol-3-phosphate transport system permease component